MSETYRDTPASYREWCGKKTVRSFRPHTSIRPHFSGGNFEEIAPGGEIKHSAAGEETYTCKVDTFGRMFTVDRRDLVNDDLNVFAELFAEIGRQAPRKLADLVYTLLLDNTASFFGSGNNNYDDGADTALSIASMTAAVTLLRMQKDANGKPIALTPKILLVPPQLEATALSIINSMEVSRDRDVDNLPTGNPWKGTLSVVVEPRLGDTDFHANASALAWYLFAGPGNPSVVTSFLNGAEFPTVEQLQPPANVLGIVMRGYQDFGADFADPRAGVKMKGEN